jgi:hypothetical protein
MAQLKQRDKFTFTLRVLPLPLPLHLLEDGKNHDVKIKRDKPYIALRREQGKHLPGRNFSTNSKYNKSNYLYDIWQ